jgi:hypothetical protein
MATHGALAREQRGHRIRQVAGWALIAVAVFVSLDISRPSQPKRIVLLTGPEGSSYHAIGTRFASELRGRGLATEVVISDGGTDNLRRLAAGVEDAVAFTPRTSSTRSSRPWKRSTWSRSAPWPANPCGSSIDRSLKFAT